MTEAPPVATHSNAHALCPTSRNLTDKQLDAIRYSDGMVGVNFAVGFLRGDGADEEDTPIETVVRRVGFGSDFDGAEVPRGIGDASGLPRLLAALRARGYDHAALKRLAHENWIRVLREVWRR
jgi:membrane dipeptidase